MSRMSQFSKRVFSTVNVVMSVGFLVLGSSNLAQAHDETCPVYPTETQCYWMENVSGHYCWVPAEIGGIAKIGDDKARCKQLDSCDGGGKESGGGCYKWSDSSDGDRYPWDDKKDDDEKDVL